MSEQENEMSDDELNSLLADLESRADAGGGAGAGAGEDDEDLEAYLSRLEAEEPSDSGGGKKVASAERDEELDARFAELDNLQPDDLPATTDEKSKKKAEKKAKKAAKKKEKQEKKKEKGKEAGEKEAGEQGRSSGARFAIAALKALAIALPVAVFAWVLGAFLANWVSAGWLIAIIALAFALGAPLLVSRYVKKGKFAWWAAGIGVLLTVALTAPMPETAGETIQDYGHWPSTAVGELAGWEADNALVKINASVAGAVGGLLYTPQAREAEGPLELGTEHSLYGQEQIETPNGGPTTPEGPGAGGSVPGTPQ